MASTSEQIGSALILCVEGKLNGGNAAELEAEILGHLNDGVYQLVLDLSAMSYISSAGLRVVLVAAKRLKQSAGELVLCGLQPAVREVFDMSGFLAILNVVGTREQALSRLNAESDQGYAD